MKGPLYFTNKVDPPSPRSFLTRPQKKMSDSDTIAKTAQIGPREPPRGPRAAGRVCMVPVDDVDDVLLTLVSPLAPGSFESKIMCTHSPK